jgi:hypothetical protein
MARCSMLAYYCSLTASIVSFAHSHMENVQRSGRQKADSSFRADFLLEQKRNTSSHTYFKDGYHSHESS